MSELRRPGLDRSLPPAVIAGVDSMQGLQAARILAGRGITVIGTAETRRHHATRSNSCQQVIIAETGDQLISALEVLGSTLEQKPVLIPCKDGIVKAISAARDRLLDNYEIVLPPHDVVEMLMDKATFYEHAEKHGYAVPVTRTVGTRAEFDAAARQMRFPCVVKPPARSKLWTAHTVEKAFLAKDVEELESIYQKCAAWSDQLIIQQWVPGDESDLYSCNVYYTREGKPAASFVARKLRQWPVDTGQSSLGEECRNDAVRDMTMELFGEVDYQGLGYLEVKRDASDGCLYMIEPNIGRPTGRSAIAEGGGVELLYTMYCDAVGLPLPDQRQQAYSGVKWIHLRRDLQSSVVRWRRGELTLSKWWSSVRGRKVYAVFSLRDPLPFFLDLWEAAKVGFRGRRFS